MRPYGMPYGLALPTVASNPIVNYVVLGVGAYAAYRWLVPRSVKNKVLVALGLRVGLSRARWKRDRSGHYHYKKNGRRRRR